MRRPAWWRGMGWGIKLGAVWAVACAGALAQGELTGQPAGGVAGRVIASDTQRPVRLASVTLQAVSSVAEGGSNGERGRFGSGSSSAFVRTDVEGNFLAEGVSPGDYYVTATAPGYVTERAVLRAAVSAGADPAALLAQLPVVHVAAGETSSATVTIERGGAIAGRVQWEDGSPAGGVQMSAVAPAGTVSLGSLPGVLQGLQAAGGFLSQTVTDDRGVYRLTGLVAGTYVVRAVVQGTTQTFGPGRTTTGSPVRVYAPGVFRRAAGKAVEVKVGEERSDVSMVIDLRGLHTVSGSVSSASAGQSVASGRVSLTDESDSELQAGGQIAADGSFSLRYVPAGSYTLRVMGASSTTGHRRGEGGETGVAYQAFSQPMTVNDTDVSNVGITLTAVASPAQ